MLDHVVMEPALLLDEVLVVHLLFGLHGTVVAHEPVLHLNLLQLFLLLRFRLRHCTEYFNGFLDTYF